MRLPKDGPLIAVALRLDLLRSGRKELSLMFLTPLTLGVVAGKRALGKVAEMAGPSGTATCELSRDQVQKGIVSDASKPGAEVLRTSVGIAACCRIRSAFDNVHCLIESPLVTGPTLCRAKNPRHDFADQNLGITVLQPVQPGVAIHNRTVQRIEAVPSRVVDGIGDSAEQYRFGFRPGVHRGYYRRLVRSLADVGSAAG